MQINAFNKPNNKFCECWNNRWTSWSSLSGDCVDGAIRHDLALCWRKWCNLSFPLETVTRVNFYFVCSTLLTVCSCLMSSAMSFKNYLKLASNEVSIRNKDRRDEKSRKAAISNGTTKERSKIVQLLEIIQTKYWRTSDCLKYHPKNEDKKILERFLRLRIVLKNFSLSTFDASSLMLSMCVLRWVFLFAQ